MKLRFTADQTALVLERFAEALRECGILWLVFSILDRLLTGELTVPWTIWNPLASIAAWLTGMYIELHVKQP